MFKKVAGLPQLLLPEREPGNVYGGVYHFLHCGQLDGHAQDDGIIGIAADLLDSPYELPR